VYGLGILKAGFVTVAFLILLRDSLKPYHNLPIAVFVLTVVATIASGRFVIRPDITLMVFLPLSIFFLNAYLYDGRKFIYSLPLVHLLWSNFHSSIILMFVPYVAFIAGGIIQAQLAKTGIGRQDAPSASQIKTICALFAVSAAASLLNPNFVGQYLYGYTILSLDFFRNDISEFQPVRNMLHLAPVYAAVAASFILSGKRFSAIHFLLVVPFLILPLVANRFLMVAAITAGPVFARNISAFLVGKGWNNLFRRRAAVAIVSAYVVLYLIVIMAGPFRSESEFGFGLDYHLAPKCAVEYMDRKDIQGRVLNTFHHGQYILWTGYPGRTVFIDGRGHIGEDLLEKSRLFRYKNWVLDELYEQYEFDSILTYNTIPRENDNMPQRDPVLPLLAHSQWALVYWDDSSLLYLRRGGKYASVIEEDEYRNIVPYVLLDSFRKNLGKMENRKSAEQELRRNLRETNSHRARTLLALLYYSTGRNNEAIELLVNSQASFDDHIILGDCYEQDGRVEEAYREYNKALTLRVDAEAFFRLASLSLKEGKTENALNYLQRAIGMKTDMPEAYLLAADIYRRQGRGSEAAAAMSEHQRLLILKSFDKYVKNGERAYSEGRYDAALKEFNEAFRTDPHDPILNTDLGYVYYRMGRLQDSHACFNRALERNRIISDPTDGIRLPNAYYGLGLVYASEGDRQTAIQYFRKYADTHSSGYFSSYYTRQARNQIDDLSQPAWNGTIPDERVP
jgi:tetratricopeptide (TPR) repeat protein